MLGGPGGYQDGATGGLALSEGPLSSDPQEEMGLELGEARWADDGRCAFGNRLHCGA